MRTADWLVLTLDVITSVGLASPSSPVAGRSWLDFPGGENHRAT